jgi:SAM-dependent methyltransferase
MYWHDRLSRHQLSLRGVGDEGLTEEDNDEEYRQAANTFKILCNRSLAAFDKLSVLDIGCGNGFYAGVLAELGVGDYTGVDVTDVLFSELRAQFPRFKFMKSDIGTSQLEGKFDLILMIDVAEHIVNDTAFACAMQNVKHCLSEHGVFIVTASLPGKPWTHSFYVKYRPVGVFQTIFRDYIFGEPLPFRDKYILSISRKPSAASWPKGAGTT